MSLNNNSPRKLIYAGIGSRNTTDSSLTVWQNLCSTSENDIDLISYYLYNWDMKNQK